MQLEGVTQYKKLIACTEDERQEFARLVRQGFKGSNESLLSRIENANLLAFHYEAANRLVAIAALKGPSQAYRDEIFRKANITIRSADYELELGWVFVTPANRGSRIAEGLCRQLLARAPTSRLFATTRSNNDVMIRILLAVGFGRVGIPFPHRDEELVLFLRS